MIRRRSSGSSSSSAADSAGEGSRAPGRSTLTQGMIQRSPAAGAATAPASAQPAAPELFQAATAGPAAEIPHRATMEAAFGQDFSGVQTHFGQGEHLAGMGAQAAASGEQVAFADSSPTVETTAHELTHVVQERQAGSGGAVHAQSVLSEPGDASEREADSVAAIVASGGSAPAITAAPGGGVQREMNTPGVGRLRTSRESGLDASVGSGTDAADAGPNQALPWNATGWDAPTILNLLGQRDTIAETDSDGTRCVQAVGIAVHVLGGPAAVCSYLRGTATARLAAPRVSARARAGAAVCNEVASRIEAHTATYGDLSWAQEALHDMYYRDVAGTPPGEVGEQIVPPFDPSTLAAMDVWCNSPAEVMAQVSGLADGQQLLIEAWRVIFNNQFDDLEERGVHTTDHQAVTVIGAGGRRTRTFIDRIDTSARPHAPDQIDLNRDVQHGHQLLIYRLSGRTYLYEPEASHTGAHLGEIARDGAELSIYMQDQPDFSTYDYIQVLGRITPTAPAASTGGGGSSVAAPSP